MIMNLPVLRRRHAAEVGQFLQHNGPHTVVWFEVRGHFLALWCTLRRRQTPCRLKSSSFPLPMQGDGALCMLDPRSEAVPGKALALTRTCLGPVARPEDIAATELPAELLPGLRSLLAELFVPLLQQQAPGQAGDAVLQDAATMVALLDAAAAGAAAPALRRPDPRLMPIGDPNALVRAADAPTAHKYTALLTEWCVTVEAAAADPQEVSSSGSSSIDEELQRLRQRTAQLAVLSQAAHGEDGRALCAVAGAASPSLVKRWREAKVALGEAALRAQDGMRFLTSMRPALEPLRSGEALVSIHHLFHYSSSLRLLSHSPSSFSCVFAGCGQSPAERSAAWVCFSCRACGACAGSVACSPAGDSPGRGIFPTLWPPRRTGRPAALSGRPAGAPQQGVCSRRRKAVGSAQGSTAG